MPANITESDDYPVTLQTPLSGELASAPGLLLQFMQGATNRTNWIRRRLLGQGTSLTPLLDANEFTALVEVPSSTDMPAPNVFTRIAQPLANRTSWLRNRVYGATLGNARRSLLGFPMSILGWEPRVEGNVAIGQGQFSYVQTILAGYMYFAIPTPVAGRISLIQAYGLGSGHVGTVESPVRFELITIGDGASSPTILHTLVDGAPYPVYDSNHITASSGLSVVINNALTYAIRVVAEYGANSVPFGYRLFDLQVGFSA